MKCVVVAVDCFIMEIMTLLIKLLGVNTSFHISQNISKYEKFLVLYVTLQILPSFSTKSPSPDPATPAQNRAGCYFQSAGEYSRNVNNSQVRVPLDSNF